MALIDILKSRKREEVKPERLSRGALKQIEKPAKKPARFKAQTEAAKKDNLIKKRNKKTEAVDVGVALKKSALAAEFILHPYITEQSNILAQSGIYTFKVSPRANKIIIKRAIKEMYGFDPIKIRIVNIHSKKRISRGRVGIKSGFKKALVYLKKGDKIEFV